MRYPTREYQSDSSSLPLGRSDDCVQTTPRTRIAYKPGAGLEVLSNNYRIFTLDKVFPYQKSNCAVILKNRADMIDNGSRYVDRVGPDGAV